MRVMNLVYSAHLTVVRHLSPIIYNIGEVKDPEPRPGFHQFAWLAQWFRAGVPNTLRRGFESCTRRQFYRSGDLSSTVREKL